MKNRKRQRLITIWSTLAYAVVLPALLTWVTNDHNKGVIVLVLVIVMVPVGIVVERLMEAIQRRALRPTITSQDPQPRRGLVITVGPGSLAVRDGQGRAFTRILGHVQPEFVVLLAGPQLSNDDRQSLEQLPRLTLNREVPVEIRTIDAGRVDQAGALSAIHALRHREVQPEDIVVDITGGTLSMSLSAFLAARETGCDVQLIQQNEPYNFWVITDA